MIQKVEQSKTHSLRLGPMARCSGARGIRWRERNRGGFTLIELLVSIAIIFLLISTALVALKSAQRASARTTSLNALKQLMVGYTGYQEAHKGMFLPGYLDEPTLTQLNIKTKLQSGHVLGCGSGACDASAYVWRMAPYIDNAWKTYMADYRNASLESIMNREYGTGDANGAYGPASISSGEYGIANRPSFGLNSIFLGGDTTHGSSSVVNCNPWNNAGNKRIAALRMSEVKNPTQLVVFAPSQEPPPPFPAEPSIDPTGVRLGYPELRSPIINLANPNGGMFPQEWTLDAANDGRIVYASSGPAGVPISRLGDSKISIGKLDGSVGAEELGRLAVDMTRWSPFVLTTN